MEGGRLAMKHASLFILLVTLLLSTSSCKADQTSLRASLASLVNWDSPRSVNVNLNPDLTDFVMGTCGELVVEQMSSLNSPTLVVDTNFNNLEFYISTDGASQVLNSRRKSKGFGIYNARDQGYSQKFGYLRATLTLPSSVKLDAITGGSKSVEGSVYIADGVLAALGNVTDAYGKDEMHTPPQSAPASNENFQLGMCGTDGDKYSNPNNSAGCLKFSIVPVILLASAATCFLI